MKVEQIYQKEREKLLTHLNKKYEYIRKIKNRSKLQGC